MTSVIASVCLLSKDDPQRNIRHSPDRSYFNAWHQSLTNHKQHGIIFYDNLSPDLVEQSQNDYITFIKDSQFASQYLSAEVYRFLAYFHYFQHHYFDTIFVTDCSDVVLASSLDKDLASDTLYVGSVCRYSRIEKSRWCRKRFNGIYPDFPFYNKILLNAGTVGGKYDIFMQFLNYMNIELQKITTNIKVTTPEIKNTFDTADMPVFNYVCYKYFNNRIVTGPPVHSRFKKYENERRDVWFIHK